jgi:holo-[acyl-carrier protein] synthase
MITLPGELDGLRVRIGCDVVPFEDVQDSLAAFGDRYLRKVFTASEINDCQGRNRVHRLAARFAAKEAVIKAFSEPDMPFPWREIEVTRDGPLPLLRLSGALAERARHQGWLSSSLSLSHADCHAMAVVLVVCSPAESGRKLVSKSGSEHVHVEAPRNRVAPAVDDPTFSIDGGDAGAGAR